MINNSFELFKSEVDFILNHIEVISIQAGLIKDLHRKANEDKNPIEKRFLELYSLYHSKEKQMLYSSNVVFLYGIFEQFVESSIREYIEEVCSIVQEFDDHDEAIKKNYFDLIINLRSKLDWGGKFVGLNEELLAMNLYTTLYDRDKSILFQCFLRNGGNYNHDKVSDAINAITGIDFKQLLSKYNPLKHYLDTTGLCNSDLSLRYAKLNELVKARNDIAHNGRPAEMLGDDELKDTIHFLKLYAESLTEFLNDSLYRKLWEIQTKDSSAMIFIPTNYYSKQRTAAFEETNVLVYKGQKVLVKMPEKHFPQYFVSMIKEINQKKLDGRIVYVEEIESNVLTEFSIKLEEKVSKKSQILVL